MKSRELLAASEANRLDLLSAIGAKRDSYVISYLTSTRPGLSGSIRSGDVDVIEKHVRQAKAEGAANLDFLIYTWGGATVAPWDFTAMVRDYFPRGKIGVILPAAAYSAGTMIALGADEIIATPTTQLGPVDSSSHWISFNWYDGRSSMSALRGFYDLVESTGLKGKLIEDRMVDWLTLHTDALALGEMHRTMKENRRIVENILASRLSPPGRNENKQLLDFFLYEAAFHSQAIRRREAARHGLSTITDIEVSGLETYVTNLFTQYTDILKLNTPFARANMDGRTGDDSDFDVLGEHASETPIVLIESLLESDAAYVSYGLRHWNDTPPVPEKPAPQTQPVQARHAYDVSWNRQAHQRLKP